MSTSLTDGKYWVPIDPPLLRKIAELLRARSPFTPSFCSPGTDPYDPVTYRHVHRLEATRTTALCDRNLVSRWIDLVVGIPPTAEHRMAAGVMAFALCSDISIEPALALYEGAAHFGNEHARNELLTFRTADHTHPGYWAEIALGVADFLGEADAVSLRDDDATIDFTQPLRRWRRNYVLALKLAELELEGGSAASRMSRLVRWMYDEFLLGGPAIALASALLAPNGPRKRLLKGLRSPDRETAIAGIQNAAWDLTLVSQWLRAVEAQEPTNELTLLVSLDRSVHQLARTVASVNDEANPLAEQFRKLWGDKRGTALSAEVQALYDSRDLGYRTINGAVPPGFVDDAIEMGEARIRAWRPRG